MAPKMANFSSMDGLLNKKLMVVLFRWITILISSVLLYYKQGTFSINDPAVVVLLIITISNAILTFVKQSFFEQPKYIFLILLADIAAISILFKFISSESHLYIVFFAVLFISSISQNVKWSVFVAMIASIFYLSVFSLGKTANLATIMANPEIAIKIPFIFLTAIWTSFWSEQYRRKKEEEEKVKQFNKELEEGIRSATEIERRLSGDLMKMKEYNENILQSLNSGIIVINKQGIVTMANPKAKEIIDSSSCNLIGRKYSDIEELSPMENLLTDSLQKGRENGVHEIALNNGKILHMTLSPLKESAQTNGATMVFQDITAMKTMMEKMRQSESLANLGKTVAWIAHEIRNSLTNIIGYAQLIEMKYGNEEMNRLIMPLIKATETISSFINDILDFSKNRQIKKEAVNIEQLFDEIEGCFAYSMNGTKLLIQKNDTESNLISNSEALKCIITNLIRNAKESIDEVGGSGVIKLSAARRNGNFIIAVCDTGKGMDKKTMDSVFNPFFTTKTNGTGLGLSIVKKVLESLEGRITVSSTPGMGTKFELAFPTCN
jgi:two-component system sensor histidine kinase FlrB